MGHVRRRTWKITQNLGNAFFYTVIGMALFALLAGGIVIGGKTGILPIMGQTVEEQTNRQKVSETSLAEVKALQERNRPEVTVQETLAGRSYTTDELFSATDADGNRAEVTLLNASYEVTDVTEDIYENNAFIFAQSGTYRLKVRVTDQMGVSNICQVYVTCNG